MKEYFHGLNDLTLNIKPVNQCEKVVKELLLKHLKMTEDFIYRFREEVNEP